MSGTISLSPKFVRGCIFAANKDRLLKQCETDGLKSIEVFGLVTFNYRTGA